MNISKKQLALIGYIEKCGWVLRCDVSKAMHPNSIIDAVIAKGLVTDNQGRLTTTFAGITLLKGVRNANKDSNSKGC